MTELIRTMWAEDEGQDLVEYALLAALLAIVSILALTTLGTTIAGVWGQIQTAIAGA